MTETKINLKKNQIPSTQTDNTCKNPSALPQGSTEMEISNKTEMQRLPAKLEMQPGVVLNYFTEESIEKQNLHVSTYCTYKIEEQSFALAFYSIYLSIG